MLHFIWHARRPIAQITFNLLLQEFRIASLLCLSDWDLRKVFQSPSSGVQDCFIEKTKRKLEILNNFQSPSSGVQDCFSAIFAILNTGVRTFQSPSSGVQDCFIQRQTLFSSTPDNFQSPSSGVQDCFRITIYNHTIVGLSISFFRSSGLLLPEEKFPWQSHYTLSISFFRSSGLLHS